MAPESDTPRDVEGLWWGMLDKGVCLWDNMHYYGDYNNTRYRCTNTEGSYCYKYDGEFLKHYQVPVYTVPFIFGTTSNVIILIIIMCNKDMRTVSNMYILNLDISNIIYFNGTFLQSFCK